MGTVASELERTESVGDGVRRLAAARLEQALEQLGASRSDAAHQVRKAIKQVRALLRLVRSELGEARFEREDHKLRELARPLSRVRDAEALVESVAVLGPKFQGRDRLL